MKVIWVFLAIISCKVYHSLAVLSDNVDLHAANLNPKTGPLICEPGKVLKVSSSINDLLIIYTSDEYHGGEIMLMDFMYANLLVLITHKIIGITSYFVGLVLANTRWEHSVENGLHGGIKAYIGCVNGGFDVYIQENHINGDAKTTYRPVKFYGNINKREFWVMGEIHEDLNVVISKGNMNYLDKRLPYNVHMNRKEVTKDLVCGEIKLIAYLTHHGFSINFKNYINSFHNLFQMRTDFHNRKIVLDSFQDGSWGDEVVIDQRRFPFPFTPNIYEINIVFGQNQIEIIIDGEHLISFPYRMKKILELLTIDSTDSEETNFNVVGLEIIWQETNSQSNWVSQNKSLGNVGKGLIKAPDILKSRRRKKLRRHRKRKNKGKERSKFHKKNASKGQKGRKLQIKNASKGKKRSKFKMENPSKNKKRKKIKRNRVSNGKKRRNFQNKNVSKGKKKEKLSSKNFSNGKKRNKFQIKNLSKGYKKRKLHRKKVKWSKKRRNFTMRNFSKFKKRRKSQMKNYSEGM